MAADAPVDEIQVLSPPKSTYKDEDVVLVEVGDYHSGSRQHVEPLRPPLLVWNADFSSTSAALDLTADEVSRRNAWHRRNSWQLPVHLANAATFTVLLLHILAFFLLAVRLLASRSARVALWTVGATLTAALLATLAYTTSVDPSFTTRSIAKGNTDDGDDIKTDKDKRNLGFRKTPGVPVIDSTTHTCGVCGVHISTRAVRHCRACNRCASGFDHHCDYLSTCIGSRNYGTFVASVVLGAVLNGMLCATAAVAFSHRFSSEESFATRASLLFAGSNSKHYVADVAAALCMVVCVSSLATCCALVFLTLFHARLAWYGLPTWAYLDVADEMQFDVQRTFAQAAAEERTRIHEALPPQPPQQPLDTNR